MTGQGPKGRVKSWRLAHWRDPLLLKDEFVRTQQRLRVFRPSFVTHLLPGFGEETQTQVDFLRLGIASRILCDRGSALYPDRHQDPRRNWPAPPPGSP